MCWRTWIIETWRGWAGEPAPEREPDFLMLSLPMQRRRIRERALALSGKLDSFNEKVIRERITPMRAELEKMRGLFASDDVIVRRLDSIRAGLDALTLDLQREAFTLQNGFEPGESWPSMN